MSAFTGVSTGLLRFSRRRRWLLLLAALLVGGYFLLFGPCRIAFLYNDGVIAAEPNEVLTLRLYYTCPVLRWAKVNVLGLIGDDDKTIKLLRTSGKSPLWVWPIRKIDVELTITRGADSVLSGALVELNGRRQVLPLGRIRLDCIAQGEARIGSTPLKRFIAVSPNAAEVMVNFGEGLGSVVETVTPMPRLMKAMVAASDDNSWQATFADELPGPRCIIYRPAVCMAHSGTSATVLGPMMQFLIGAPLPLPAQRALLQTTP